MFLRDLFNERKWHAGDLAALVLVVRHRGAPGDQKVVLGASILEIGASGLTVEARDAAGEPVDDGRAFLPWHRILRVESGADLLFERAAPR